MLYCFTLPPCDVNVAVKQLKKDRCFLVTLQLLCVLTVLLTIRKFALNGSGNKNATQHRCPQAADLILIGY